MELVDQCSQTESEADLDPPLVAEVRGEHVECPFVDDVILIARWAQRTMADSSGSLNPLRQRLALQSCARR